MAAFKRGNLLLSEEQARVAGPFARSPVPLDATAECVTPQLCVGTCSRSFSAYTKRLAVLRHRTPMAPLLTVLSGEHLHDPYEYAPARFRRQILTRIEAVAVCAACGQVGEGLLFDGDPRVGGYGLATPRCREHAGITALTAAEVADRVGVSVTFLSLALSRFLAGQRERPPARPSAARAVVGSDPRTRQFHDARLAT